MKKIKVISKKYDGSLRDEYDTFLYIETDEIVTLFSPPGINYWDYRKGAWFTAQDGLLEIYFKYRWYNVWHICEQVSNTNLVYVNIAMPVEIKEMSVEWIDLDLDYRVNLNQSVELLDSIDFEQNVHRMGYTPEMIEAVRRACRDVEAGLSTKAYPFNYEQQVELYNRIKLHLS